MPFSKLKSDCSTFSQKPLEGLFCRKFPEKALTNRNEPQFDIKAPSTTHENKKLKATVLFLVVLSCIYRCLLKKKLFFQAEKCGFLAHVSQGSLFLDNELICAKQN